MKILNKMVGFKGLLAAAIIFACFSPLTNLSAELTALEIMKRVDKRDDGKTSISEMTMVLIDRKGKQRIKKMKGFRKDFGEDTKNISFFLSPEDERNVAFLSHEWEDDSKEDDNWLFLPALGRPKRISGTGKKGSFMGSDFSYADMNGLELSDWDFKILKKSAMIKGHDCWIIQAVPKPLKLKKVSDETGYKKSIAWVRKDIFMTIQSRLYLEKGRKYKNFIASDIEKIQGIWTAKKLSMISLKGKKVEHSTVLKFDSMIYNEGVEDNMFTVQRMVRGL